MDAPFFLLLILLTSVIALVTAVSFSFSVCKRETYLSGATMGLATVGLSLLGITLILYILSVIFGETWETALLVLAGFAAGISFVALFARVRGGMIDLLESHVLAMIAAITLGSVTIGTDSAMFFPLMIASFSILTSVIASAFVRTRKSANAANTLLLLFATFILARRFFPAAMAWDVSTALIAGMIGGLLIRFLMGRTPPSSRTAGTSVLLLILVIAIAHASAGIYGIALAAVGMLSILETTDRGYATAASLLAALALIVAFGEAAMLPAIDAKEPMILIGLFLGGVLPFLFSSMMVHASTTMLHETMAPAILAIGAPLLVGSVLGLPALAGLLIGSIITGMPLSISMLSRPSCDLRVEGLLKVMAVVSLLTASLT